MTPIEALHNAARWYCAQGFDRHVRAYQELTAARGERMTFRSGAWEYSDDAWDLFPRYHVLAAIRSDVEHFTPADFGSVAELMAMLEAAAETAQSSFTDLDHPVAVRAMADERRKFLDFVRSADAAALAGVPRLPFRRVLGAAEHAALHEAFARRWGKWYGGCVKDAPPGTDAVTLHVEAMETPGAYDELRRALAEHGVGRLLELREFDDGYELDVEAAGFTYNGAEGFWTAGDMEWMVYASHESSITFGGTWLVARMRQSLPGFDRYLYRGWDLGLYE
jgi:hypothetical protein